MLPEPGSSFINRFQCQSPGSLQVGVLGRTASLGICLVRSAPGFTGFQKAGPESPTKFSQLCSYPPPAAGTFLGGLPQILPWILNLSCCNMKHELDQQILSPIGRLLTAACYPSSTANQLCDLGQVAALFWASASACVS